MIINRSSIHALLISCPNVRNQRRAAVFTVDQVIADNYPELNNSRLFAPILKPILRRLLHEQAFIDFARAISAPEGHRFR